MTAGARLGLTPENENPAEAGCVVPEPVRLRPRLDPDNHDTASLKPLLAPAPEEGFTEWPVSRALNNPRHEGPACAESVEKTG